VISDLQAGELVEHCREVLGPVLAPAMDLLHGRE
jgi:hypothetical protein